MQAFQNFTALEIEVILQVVVVVVVLNWLEKYDDDSRTMITIIITRETQHVVVVFPANSGVNYLLIGRQVKCCSGAATSCLGCYMETSTYMILGATCLTSVTQILWCHKTRLSRTIGLRSSFSFISNACFLFKPIQAS